MATLQTRILWADSTRGVVELRAKRNGREDARAALDALRGNGAAAQRVFLHAMLDTSGSMKANEVFLNQAVQTLVKLLPENVELCISTFDTSVQTIVPTRRVGTDSDMIAASIKLSADGEATNLYDAARTLVASARPDCVSHLVLMTDGVANMGPMSTYDIEAVVRSNLPHDACAILTTIGFNRSEQLQVDLLTRLAGMTDGDFHQMNTRAGFLESFGDVAADLFCVQVTNVSATASDGCVIRAKLFEDKQTGVAVRLGTPRYIPFQLQRLGSSATASATLGLSYRIMGGALTKLDVKLERGTDAVNPQALRVHLFEDAAEALATFRRAAVVGDAPRGISTLAEAVDAYDFSEEMEEDEVLPQPTPMEEARNAVARAAEGLRSFPGFLEDVEMRSLESKLRATLDGVLSAEDVDQTLHDTVHQRSRNGAMLSSTASAAQRALRTASVGLSQDPRNNSQAARLAVETSLAATDPTM